MLLCLINTNISKTFKTGTLCLLVENIHYCRNVACQSKWSEYALIHTVFGTLSCLHKSSLKHFNVGAFSDLNLSCLFDKCIRTGIERKGRFVLLDWTLKCRLLLSQNCEQWNPWGHRTGQKKKKSVNMTESLTSNFVLTCLEHDISSGCTYNSWRHVALGPAVFSLNPPGKWSSGESAVKKIWKVDANVGLWYWHI